MIKLLLTIPATSCTAKRSFSALRRLKTYLRPTYLLPILLNSTAVLHIHSDVARNHNLEAIMDEFISRNKIRSSTFACSTRLHILYI
ncbi:hypothetical protein ALC57_06090 [Trachymyrmex cornetzi]|uniref:Uncharacterized protein n=1 Tax=Trachymyrmex cornetzi TaxID=471704 RepID=A0A195E9I5_9HYME|nr:hypothetical protein ALC57_06090 [Trachymyrmex cornetzi]